MNSCYADLQSEKKINYSPNNMFGKHLRTSKITLLRNMSYEEKVFKIS
jgi:hypothetical protein